MLLLFLVFTVCLAVSAVEALSGQLPGTSANDGDNWVELPEVAALFQEAGVEGTFVLCEAAGEAMVGFNRAPAWLDGPLEISAVEQVRLLGRLTRNGNYFNKSSLAAR